MSEITSDTAVEVLVTEHPAAIDFLAGRGILCVVCGEPYWGTLGQLIAQKRLTANEAESLLKALNAHVREREACDSA